MLVLRLDGSGMLSARRRSSNAVRASPPYLGVAMEMVVEDHGVAPVELVHGDAVEAAGEDAQHAVKTGGHGGLQINDGERVSSHRERSGGTVPCHTRRVAMGAQCMNMIR